MGRVCPLVAFESILVTIVRDAVLFKIKFSRKKCLENISIVEIVLRPFF
jgi:hypothetical protein